MGARAWRTVVPVWRVERLAAQAKRLVSARARREHGMRMLDERDNRCIQQILAYVLRRHSNCIDIGANRGNILRLMYQYAPQGRHFAFEPLPELAADLRQRFTGAQVFEIALNDAPGAGQFHHVIDQPARSGLDRRGDVPARARVDVIPVQMARLDDVVPENIDFALVKIDVEGAELEVLEGAKATLARCRPHVIVEHGVSPRPVGPGTSGESSSARLWRYFDDAGFTLFGIDGRGPLSLTDFLRVRELWNFLARPW